MNPINCRLFDFQIDNRKYEDDDGSDDDGMKKTYKDNKVFEIQIFGIDEVGDTYCLFVNNFKPFFYIEVDDDWTRNEVNLFYNKLREEVTKYYSDSILQCKLIQKKSLYGFDNDKYYNFIFIEFENIMVFNKVKSLYFEEGNLKKGGYPMNFGRKETKTKIYESNIPPLLRYFHIQNISPSGWVTIEKYDNCDNIKRTTCKTEVIVSHNNIIPNNEKETRVPYKICSFDIEASSSHGDFPLPVKTYKKLAKNIVDHFNNYEVDDVSDRLKTIILYAFGFDNYASEEVDDIERVYPKKTVNVTNVLNDFEKWLKNEKIRGKKNEKKEIDQILKFLTSNNLDDDDDDNNFSTKSRTKITQNNIEDVLSSDLPNEEKTNWIDESLSVIFPRLEGDKVTFIGSTFLTYGAKEPYLNHCLVLNSCDNLDNVNNSEIETCQTEKQLLKKWADLIQKEDPDIIIGYNIFGFDYEFMFQRSMELNCKDQFLKLSRNLDEVCYTKNRDGQINIEQNKIIIASGEHDLKYIKMTGRLQVDMYNYFRRDFNLSSYKLDSVAGQYIGDNIKSIEHSNEQTIVKTNNMTGLYVGSFIQFEETSHSTEYYKDGTKFEIVNINKENKTFTIDGIEELNFKHKIRWGLSKDDVTPKDIFRLTNGDAKDRAIVAKYCIQDCNLVHHLMNKLDVLTGYVEMAKICSVPINFLVLRGQGIKLTSFIAKKCREKDTLMPVLYRKMNDDGYEGAIVLPPKCSLYLDNPVACVDYASLYPSSMISENLSHDSKVWTISYDLNGNVVNKEGILDEFNNFKYDNLPDYEYVDITYDTYQYIRSNPTKAAVKVRNGTKTCRWAQHKDKRRAIMPSILEELLAARKATKKLMKNESDDFMKNILDKRQVSYKLTANSLYGQCGARTSTFYEKDVAASTTATGRLLLTYAKRLIEEVYGKRLCNTTKHGLVMSNAEYVYGDSVAKYTPTYVKVDDQIQILEIEYLAEKFGNNNWNNFIENGKQEKEYCELNGVETWTEKGWTKLHRVIRHKLAPHKKMVRILTHTGVVDVTDDHSLLLENGTEISPKDVNIGTKLLQQTMKTENNSINNNIHDNNINDTIELQKAKIYGFFFGDGSCGSYDCPSGQKSSWALNNSNPNLIEKYMELCKECYPEYRWITYDTLKSSKVYKISFKCDNYGEKKQFIQKYRSLLYQNNSKIIPDYILNGNIEIQKAFWEGLYDADGDKDPRVFGRIDQKNQISAAQICWLANSIGYKTSINTRSDKPNIYRINTTTKKQRKCAEAIKKIENIEYNDYVYDLTTDNHHFAAGVGNIIVHNTDSVFFTFNLQTPEGEDIRGKKALEITIELAKEAGALASKFLKKPHDLEYEKTFMPFCLLSKKRYVGLLYEEDINVCCQKSMGIVLKRRDNAPIVKDIYGGIIDILMKEQDIDKAVAFLRSCLQTLMEEKYPIDKLIITKSLRSNYKNPKQIAHKVLADRIGKREPGNKPTSGDRIPFVYIVNNTRGSLQGERIETPMYIRENKLKIDYSFYITNQIMKPVRQLFALVLEDITDFNKKLFKVKAFNATLKKLQKELPLEQFEKKRDDIREKEIKTILFDEYLIKIQNVRNNNRTIECFF
jgi:DNA polymerase elongation subunit (family B)